MIDISKHFKSKDGYRFDDYVSYTSLVGLLGKIGIESSDTDYQGDSFYLLEKNEKYGYLTISWGSCSGCDALQACGDVISEIQDLFNGLERSVVWFDSFEEIKEWINNRDWEGTIEYHTGCKNFLKEFREYHLRVFS